MFLNMLGSFARDTIFVKVIDKKKQSSPALN